MSNIYLVNPSERAILDNAGDRLPIGLLSIASYLKSEGHEAHIVDLNHQSRSEFISQLGPMDNVGISVYTSPSYTEAVSLAQEIRGLDYCVRTIAGGHHATHMPESLTPHFDAVVKGEGEKGMLKALNHNGVIDEGPANLDELPNLDYTMLNMDNYGMDQSGRRTGTIITSRGCPYSCGFCGKLERKVRFEPVRKVREQIDEFFWKGFNGLYFLDDVFTLKSDHMKEISAHAYHKGMPFRVTTRANLVDEYKLDTLKEDGCEWLSLGIESGNDDILHKSNKGLTVLDNYNAIKMAGERGIKVKGFFILGLPGETEKTARQTIDVSKRMREVGLTTADFYYLTPFPGTPIWNFPGAFGIEITDKDYTKYLEAGKTARCVVNTEELQASRIEELVEEAREEWS